MFYYELDLKRTDTKWNYNYISSLNHEFATGIAWDENNSPMFLIEKVQSVCVDPGSYYDPPEYDVEEIESITVRPRLKYPKRSK